MKMPQSEALAAYREVLRDLWIAGDSPPDQAYHELQTRLFAQLEEKTGWTVDDLHEALEEGRHLEFPYAEDEDDS